MKLKNSLKVPTSIRTSKAANALVKLQRGLKSKGNVSKGSRAKFNINIKIFGFSLRNSLILSFAMLAMLFIIFNLIYYFRLDTYTYGNQLTSALQDRQELLDTKLNILFIGLNDRSEEYRFIEMLTVVSVDFQSDTTKIYTFNTNFTVLSETGRTNLKSYLNSSLGGDYDTKIGNFVTEFENFSGLQIERYMAFNFSNYQNYLKYNDIASVVQYSNFESGDKVFNINDQIRGEDLFNYLFDDKENSDLIIKRQGLFLKDYLDKFKNPFKFLQYYYSFDNYNNLYKTDMNKIELINFLLEMSASNIIYNDKYSAYSAFARELDLKVDKGVVPDYVLIDQNINQFFRDIEVMKEQVSIEVYNSTEVAGLATKYQRVLENMGANVIKFGNYPEKIEENLIFIPNNAEGDNNHSHLQNNLNMVRRVMNGDVKIATEDYKYNFSGDIILILGKAE